MTIEVSRTISMGHRLLDYDGICSSPHGHNMKVTLTIFSEGFTDFKFVDAVLNEKVLQDMDHAMILWHKDPLVENLRVYGFRLYLLTLTPTTENIAEHIFEVMRHHFLIQQVHVQETDKYGVTCTNVNKQVLRVV